MSDSDQLPVSDLDRLPVSDLDRLPVSDLDRLPVFDLDQLPELSRMMAGLAESALAVAVSVASDLVAAGSAVSAAAAAVSVAAGSAVSAAAAAVTLPAVQSSAVLELSAAQSLMAWTHYCQVKVMCLPLLPQHFLDAYSSMHNFPLHKLPSEPLKKQAFQFSQLILELLLPLKAQYQTVQNHQAPSFLQEALNTELTYCS